MPQVTSSIGPQERDPAAIDRHVRAALHAGSSLYHLDSELLEHLQPDLIVTQELCAVCAVSYEIVARAAKRLRSDPRVVSLEPFSLDDVLATIALLGELTNRVATAREAVSTLQERAAALYERNCASASRPRTLVLEWTDPPMSAGHWIPGLIELAGGEPLLGNPGANSQRLSWDQIAAAQPEAVVVAPCGFDLDATRRAIASLDAVPQWRALPASRGGRVLAMDGNAYLSRPGPRLLEAADMIAAWYTGGAEHAG